MKKGDKIKGFRYLTSTFPYFVQEMENFIDVTGVIQGVYDTHIIIKFDNSGSSKAYAYPKDMAKEYLVEENLFPI